MNHRVDPVTAEPRTQADLTIAERLEQIERALKFDPNVPYRRQLIREYLDLTTDPNEAKNGNR